MLRRGKALFSINGVVPFLCFPDIEYRPSHAQIATLTPPAKVSGTEAEGLFGVRKLACAFHEEACFRLCRGLRSNVLKAFMPGSKLPSEKAAASYRTPHLASGPTLVGVVNSEQHQGRLADTPHQIFRLHLDDPVEMLYNHYDGVT